ncbi:MAG: bile acid:sodium symporter family protein [Bacteroidaceae bacterium]|nr:bile acid:sodium symporter family protein [Bacteroidaceae bacterium]
MNILYKISGWIAGNLTLIIVAVTALALWQPASFTWISIAAITPLLAIVMFGMGLTMKPADFGPIFTRPKEIIIGELAQFIIMPMLAWLLCYLLKLPTELALGMILVGCCPGGTASNVMCYLAKGDVPLSIAMTTVSTLLAPIVTPALVLLLTGKEIHVDVFGMFISIVQVVILPVSIGFIINHFFGKYTRRIVPLMPMISALAVMAIIGVVVSCNQVKILQCSLIVAVAVILHNTLGLVLGYLLGKCARLSKPKSAAISIEVGMQNAGLATSLATIHFAMYPMAAVPGALFSIWHNLSGSIAASIFRKGNKS